MNQQARPISPTSNMPAKRTPRCDQVAGLMLLALALYVWWMNRAYPLGTLAEPGPGYMPLLLAIFMGVMGVLVVITGARSQPVADIDWSDTGRAFALLVACGVATFALEKLGYRITVAALLIFLLGVMERRTPWMVALVGIGFSVATYYVFATLLRVPLPVSAWGV